MQNRSMNDAPNGVEIGTDTPDLVEDLLQGPLGGLERQVLVTEAEIGRDRLVEFLQKYGTPSGAGDEIELADKPER